jgi:toxin FitB
VSAGFLLDTNVISEFTKPRPEPRVLAFFMNADPAQLQVPDAVLAEIRFGIETLPDASPRHRYRNALENHIRPLFAGRVLSADEDTWLIWKRMERDGRRRRYTFPQPDLVIAALAEQHGLAVVTRDVEPFREAGVIVRNPWEG